MNALPLRGLAALALLCLLPRAWALTVQHSFTFTQYGYDQGAYAQGVFTVMDADGDGIVTEDNPIDLESIGGFVRLIGHPTVDVSSFIFQGWVNTNTMEFFIAGDSFLPITVNWFGRSSAGPGGVYGGFSFGFVELTSTEPLVVSRTPDRTSPLISLGIGLIALVCLHRRMNRSRPTE